MLVKLRLEQLEFDREKPELERPHRNQLAEVPPPAPSLLFWTGAPPRRARWGAISVSAFVHALVIWTSVAYLHYLAGLPPDPVEAILHARVLEITTHRAFQFHISDDATKGAAEELAKSRCADGELNSPRLAFWLCRAHVRAFRFAFPALVLALATPVADAQ